METTKRGSVAEAVTDPDRLAALEATGLLDSVVEEAFDRLTRMAGLITGSPVSLVSLVDEDRQFFKSIFGAIAEPYMSQRQTPLSHSFCKHVVADNQPLIVDDARSHPTLKDNKATSDLDVVGYLGMPLTTTDGHPIGSFCVIDTEPRQWTEDEINIVRELAMSVMTEIDLRAQIAARQIAEAELQTRNNQYKRVYHFTNTTLNHMKDMIELGADADELAVYISDMERELARL